MPDVGVLNLTIKDNSNEAAGGLAQLATNLGSVKTAASGYDLSNVAQQIASVVNAVKENDKTVAALGTLFNAIANFSKIKTPKINVQPIQEIKDTLGNGWNLGQAGTQLNKIRDALDQEWNTENAYNMNYALVSIAEGVRSVSGTSIKSVANNLGNLADKMNEFADAASKVTSSSGAHDIFMQVLPSIKNVDYKPLGMDAMEGYSIGIEQGKGAVTSAVADVLNAGVESGRETQDSHSPSRVYEQLGVDAAEGYINGLRSKLADVTAAVSAFVRSAIQSSQEAMPMAAPEVAAAIRSAYSTALKDSNLPEAAKEVILKAAEEAASFTNALATSAPKEAFSDVAAMASSFTRSIMTTTTEGALDYSEKLNGDLQQFNNTVQEAGGSIHNNVTEEIQQAAEKTETLCDNIQYFSRVLGEIPKAKPLYSSLEDAFNGIRDGGRKVEGDMMSSWLHGQGNKHENLYALKTMAHEFGMTVDEVKQKVAELLAAEQALAAGGNGAVPGLQNVGSATQGMTEFSASVENGKKTSSELTGKLKSLDGELKSKKKDTDQASSGFANFKSSLEKAFPAINTLKNRLKTVLTRQIAMKLINAITSGFSEGIQNLYNYSKVMGTEFKPTMDSAASSILYMKNSLGASLAPVITSLVPVLRTVINWFVTLINYVNQFFALLNGQSTWTKALETQTEAYKDQTKAAKGASSAAKDLLADWDELNIIQSNSGGGGGGGGGVSTPDYASMFEEVGVFEGWLTDLVDGIEEQFGSIWNLVKKVGIAILGWKLSNGFKGWLGKLSGFLAGAQIIDLVFELSTMFTNKYLDTGEKGWLVADVLMTAVGSVLAKKALSKVLAGEAGLIPIPITFAVSALATILANVGKTDVSALDEKSIAASVTAALEGGVAGGFLAHIAGASLKTSLIGGVAAAIATFGVAIGIKADARVSAEGITEENIIAKLESIAALGIGGAIVGAKAASVIGVSVGAGAAGMAMLFGGAPIVTWGVSVGIKATSDVVETGTITQETVKEDLIAAGLVGAGLTIGAAVLAGTAGTIAAVGLGGAIITFGGLIGLQMIISEGKSTVKWGNYKATEEQIKAFVEDEKHGIFKVNPNTVLEIIDPLIEVKNTSEEGLTTKVNEVKVIAKKISLGLDDNELLSDLEKKIFGDEATGSTGLIGQFKETAKAHKEIIETSLTLVPMTANADGTTKELIDRQSEAWKQLTDGMDSLGEELAKHLANAYDENIDEETKRMELKTINELTNMMTNVSAAMAQGEQYEIAYQALQDNLDNLSQGSWDNVFTYVDEYQKQIKKSFTEAYDEGTKSMGKLVAGLKADMENEIAMANDSNISKTDEERKKHLANAAAYESEYNYWKGQLDARHKGRKQAIEDATKGAMNEETVDLIRDAILPLIDTNAVSPERASTISAFDGQRLRSTIWQQLFSDTGEDKEGASETVETWLLQLINDSFGSNASTIEGFIRSKFLNYGDVINKEAIDALASQIGIDEQSKEIQDAWNDLINDLVYGGNGTYKFEIPKPDTNNFTESTEEMKESAKEAASEIDEIFGEVQDLISGSSSTKKNNYNDLIAGMYYNENLGGLKQLLSDIKTLGIDTAFANVNGNNGVPVKVDPAVDSTEFHNTVQEQVKDMDPVIVPVVPEYVSTEINDVFGEIQDAIFESNTTKKNNYNELIADMYGNGNLAGLQQLLEDIKSMGVDEAFKQMNARVNGTSTNPSALPTLQNQGNVGYQTAAGVQDNEPDYSQMEAGTRRATSDANAPIVSALSMLETIARQILNKPTTAIVQPSSSLGIVNRAAAALYSKATGESVP